MYTVEQLPHAAAGMSTVTGSGNTTTSAWYSNITQAMGTAEKARSLSRKAGVVSWRMHTPIGHADLPIRDSELCDHPVSVEQVNLATATVRSWDSTTVSQNQRRLETERKNASRIPRMTKPVSCAAQAKVCERTLSLNVPGPFFRSTPSSHPGIVPDTRKGTGSTCRADMRQGDAMAIAGGTVCQTRALGAKQSIIQLHTCSRWLRVTDVFSRFGSMISHVTWALAVAQLTCSGQMSVLSAARSAASLGRVSIPSLTSSLVSVAASMEAAAGATTAAGLALFAGRLAKCRLPGPLGCLARCLRTPLCVLCARAVVDG